MLSAFCFLSLGSWAWLDKTVLDYINWGEDEPDSDFGAITTKDGTWSSGRRWHDRAYICKTPKGKLLYDKKSYDLITQSGHFRNPIKKKSLKLFQD